MNELNLGRVRVAIDEFPDPAWVWAKVSVTLETTEPAAHQEIATHVLVRSDDDPTLPELRRRAQDQTLTILKEAARLLEGGGQTH